MANPETELRRVWHGAVGHHHDQEFEALLVRLREPHRRYHTATHVMWVCRHVAALAGAHPVDDLDAVMAAALYHDAVYDPRSTSNEAASARLAERVLAGTEEWDAARRGTVAELIRSTAHGVTGADRPDTTDLATRAADDPVVATAILNDADLAVLGAEPSAYETYRRGVRAEYAHVDDKAWRRGRSQVLNGLLGRPSIFATSTMLAEREARARANLTAELAMLRV